jgi:hypothetical protein
MYAYRYTKAGKKINSVINVWWEGGNNGRFAEDKRIFLFSVYLVLILTGSSKRVDLVCRLGQMT